MPQKYVKEKHKCYLKILNYEVRTKTSDAIAKSLSPLQFIFNLAIWRLKFRQIPLVTVKNLSTYFDLYGLHIEIKIKI